jgi:PEP-CTERM motif
MRLECVATACLLALTIGSANATTFDWSLTGDPNFGITGSGTLTASASGLVDSISGSVSDTCTGTPCVPQYRPIIGLLTPGQAYGGLSDIGGDNLIFPAPASPFLDSQGLVFSIGGPDGQPCAFGAGCYMNIFYAPNASVGAPQYDLFMSNAGANGVDFVVTAEITTSVPEPSTWAMLLLGFAAVGFMSYRRKSTWVDDRLIGDHRI